MDILNMQDDVSSRRVGYEKGGIEVMYRRVNITFVFTIIPTRDFN